MVLPLMWLFSVSILHLKNEVTVFRVGAPNFESEHSFHPHSVWSLVLVAVRDKFWNTLKKWLHQSLSSSIVKISVLFITVISNITTMILDN